MSTKDELNIGSAAPDFTLEDDQGITRSLKDYRGRKIVLYFYPRDNTPGCTREACDFRDSYETITQCGAEILGVSTDTISSHKNFKSKYNLTFPLLSDPSAKVSTLYGVYKMKNRYGKTFMGIERSTFVIDDAGNISKIFRSVKVDNHSGDVLESLK